MGDGIPYLVGIFIDNPHLPLDKERCFRYNNRVEKWAGPSRAMLPKGIGMRKVRASQGRITDNVRRRKLPGKCNRNSLPTHGILSRARYRWKGEVKAHRHGRQLRANVNPIRCNTVCAAGKTRYRPGISARVAVRRMATYVTDR